MQPAPCANDAVQELWTHAVFQLCLHIGDVGEDVLHDSIADEETQTGEHIVCQLSVHVLAAAVPVLPDGQPKFTGPSEMSYLNYSFHGCRAMLLTDNCLQTKDFLNSGLRELSHREL